VRELGEREIVNESCTNISRWSVLKDETDLLVPLIILSALFALLVRTSSFSHPSGGSAHVNLGSGGAFQEAKSRCSGEREIGKGRDEDTLVEAHAAVLNE